jgi:hypothetical protein
MYPITFLSTSLLVILVASLIEISDYATVYWVQALTLLIKEVGIALFIVATITIVLEISDFKEYFIKRLEEIIVGDDYISHLDVSKLESIHEKIENRLYNGDQRTDPNSFFCKIQKEITQFVGKCYYEDFDIAIECSIIENAGQKLIKKVVHRKFDIVNPTNQFVEEIIPIGSNMKKIDGMEHIDMYSIRSVIVDSKDITKEVMCTAYETTDDPYCIDISCDYKINIPCGGKTKVETIAETLVPIDDVFYWHRIMKPCKQYRISFMIYSSDYRVEGTGFGFLYGPGLIKRMLFNRMGYGLMLRFNDWILPGDGVMFAIVHK